METPALNIDRGLRAVAYAPLGLTALTLVTFVRFEVGFKSTPTAFLYPIIVVLPTSTGGLIRAVGSPALRAHISQPRVRAFGTTVRDPGRGAGHIPDQGADADDDAPLSR